jgi:hypothetical protein
MIGQTWNHQDWRQTHQASLANPRGKNVVTRGDQAGVDCVMLEDKSNQVNEAIILVGSVLCHVQLEEKSADWYQRPTPISFNQERRLSLGGGAGGA